MMMAIRGLFIRHPSKISLAISDSHIRVGPTGAMTQRIGSPVATRPFPGTRTPARESEVAPENPITLRKDIFVVCAPRDLNDLPFVSLWEPELDPTVFTDGAEDPR